MTACILAVEDNPANLELMSYLLRAVGHDVIEARTAAQAKRLAEAHSLDLLVLDIELPDGTGYELLEQLRRNPGSDAVPAVAVTAHASADDQLQAATAGFTAYLVKPIDPRTFAATIASHIPSGANRRER
jgi:CheY-like chemotaxis protein